MKLNYLVAAVLTLMSLGAPAWARRPGEPLRPGFNTFSRQQDVQLGQEAAQEVLKKSEPVRNQFIQDYVNRVGKRLAAAPEARNSGFPFTLIYRWSLA